MTTDAVSRVDQQVDDLVRQMTLPEKVAQLGSAWVFQLADGIRLAGDRAPTLLADGIGQVTRLSGATGAGATEAAELANAIQHYLVTETRLGIPTIVHEEICSGLMARDAPVFPQAIGVASTWEPDLARAMARETRMQMRAIGAHQGLSPVLDVCRDPRWGRTEETYGEDPHLVARMGVAFVGGLQGDDLRHGVVATAKHFVGYSASEGGLNWAPAHIPSRELREVYLHPFEAAVAAAELRSVMNAYQELDGVPCAADRNLLTRILREEWGFDGTVVADYFSIRQLASYHRIAADEVEAAAIAVTAGLDAELPSTDCYGAPLIEAVRSGRVNEATVDTAVRRVLRTKFDLGLFEQPYVDVGRAATLFDTPPQRALAREIAAKSIVLLRNDGVLPLATDVGSVAVIGPNADAARHLFGDYTYPAIIESLLEARDTDRNPFGMPLDEGFSVDGASARATTVLAALRGRFGSRVRFAPGCEVVDPSRTGFADAVAVAAAADVAVLVMGDRAGMTDECTSGESRDRATLDLPGVQEHLAREVLATGTPVALVLVAGRPIGSAWLHERCAAVVMAWMPGQEGAGAIADVLGGQVNPGGKLPISFPRTVGQVPVFYGHKASGGRSNWKGDYVETAVTPLYPFGHGLSYTTFSLSAVVAGPTEASWADSVTVEATVANTGDRDGDEVVQLYIRRRRASVTRPVLELKNFVRVPVTSGRSRTVMFQLPLGQTGFYGRDRAYVVEPGEVDVLVGTSSHDLVEAGSVTVVADPVGRVPHKAFDGSVTVR
ncbi:MAG: glycoside hydrolase family 3 N-terminal domain-containing protein [Acidimicrobiales bacterium]